MGTKLASELINDARRLLQDQSSVSRRWEDDELLGILNEGQLALVGLKHDAYTRVENIVLQKGTLQQLPDDSLAFIRLTRNLGVDGSTPGRAILMVPASYLDNADPQWHSAEDSGEVYHGVFDERTERHFYVWPPAEGSTVELIHTVAPATIPDTTATVPLDDTYAPALVAYMCYGALAQDMDNVEVRALAQTWYAQFVQLLGGKIEAEGALVRG